MKWWAVPFGLVIVMGVVFVAVVLPALAGRPTVPSELVVHRSPSSAAPTQAPSATPQPTRTTASPQPGRSTTVVTPERPVVRESGDRRDDNSAHRSGEPNDR